MSAKSCVQLSIISIPVFVLFHLVWMPVQSAFAIDPAPAGSSAQWSGEAWGELQIVPVISKAGNSITARAIVRGGAAGNPSWHCSQYSGWVAAGTSSINIVIPEEWTFASGPGYVRSIGGRVAIQESSAGDPPPYGWEDRISDTCYCSVGTWGASGGCATREVQPQFLSTHQEEIIPSGASGKWVRISADFCGWNSVAWCDQATAYVYIIDAEKDLTDNDGDGLADEWEVANFGDLTTADRTSSYPDGDGLSDLQEFELWQNNSLDDDGTQYDPKAENNTGGNGGGGGGAGCGAGSLFATAAVTLGLGLLGFADRRRR